MWDSISCFSHMSSRCSNQTEATDSPIWAYNYCPTSYSWVVLMGLILYLAFFAPGVKLLSQTVMCMITNTEYIAGYLTSRNDASLCNTASSSMCLSDRYGPNALDSEFRDLPAVGPQHRKRLLSRRQLDLQRTGVSDLPSCCWVPDLLW